MRIVRRALALSLVWLVAGLPAATSPASGSACSGAVLQMETLHVEAVPEKKVYRPGDTAVVEMTVSRPAHRDPFDMGVEFTPPASAPASDITVGVTVWVGQRTYFWDMGISDEEGKATMKLRIPRSSEGGVSAANASGRNVIRSDCPDIVELGFTDYPRFFKIAR